MTMVHPRLNIATLKLLRAIDNPLFIERPKYYTAGQFLNRPIAEKGLGEKFPKNREVLKKKQNFKSGTKIYYIHKDIYNSQVKRLHVLTEPWAKAPTTIVTGSAVGTSSRRSVTFGTAKEVPIFIQPTGRWSLTGFLMTYRKEKY